MFFRPAAILFISFLTIFFFTCSVDDDGSDPGRGTLEIALTDAPVDDPKVAGVFITVKEIRVGNFSWPDFEPQTIELTAFQNGTVRSLGVADISAGAYSDITLVLDFNQDAQGNAPGCYLLTDDNQKDDLRTGADIDRAVRIFGPVFTVGDMETAAIVVDFDLRKSIVHFDNGELQPYALVTTPELEGALRYTQRENVGTIRGECGNCLTFADKVVVYAYEKGEFQKETETEPTGTSGVRFSNSVTSSTVNDQGEFSLHFLPDGDYQLYFAGYNTEEEDPGRIELAGALEINVITSPDLIDVSVSAQGVTGVTVDATGLIPL